MNSYLKLRGKSYRVETNWNAHVEYCALKGISDLSAIDNMANLSAEDLRDFVHSAVKEGERLDGREFKLTSQDLGALMMPADIVAFMRIYKDQSQVEAVSTASGQGDVKKKGLFRLRTSKG